MKAFYYYYILFLISFSKTIHQIESIEQYINEELSGWPLSADKLAREALLKKCSIIANRYLESESQLTN